MQIGRKIYYEKTNGVIIWDKGEMEGDVRETTFEEDCGVMPVLTLIDSNQLGILQLNFGDYQEEFLTCRGCKINPITNLPEFILLED